MQLDAFTLIAQIINFIILLVLLRVFLYKPIINAMNTREEKIANRLEEAESRRQQAEKQMQQYQEKRQEIDTERASILAEARDDAEQRRDQMLQDARADVDARRQQWQQAIEREKETFLRDLQQRASEQVIVITRQALADLADAELEQQIVQAFVRRVQAREDEISEYLDGGDQTQLPVYSAFELNDAQREQIAGTLAAHLPPDTELRFETDAEMICGIALRTDRYRIGWNVQHYLQSLEGSIRERLNAETPQSTREREAEPDAEVA